MTSMSSAQTRPPLLHTHPTVPYQRSRSTSQVVKTPVGEEKHVLREHGVDLRDNRPVKRQKRSADSLVTPITLDQSHLPPQIGRYREVSWLTVTRAAEENQAEQGSGLALPPLPERPWAATVQRGTSIHQSRPGVRVRKNVAVPNTPDSIEIPVDVPMFERKRRADYFPWTGKHPEDVLNEVHVKQGYFDRPPNPAEKELNTAKSTLYNAFKHRSGLDSLSAMFSLVLESKNKHCTYSSTSTFRGPPPRVTLTEAKRKSWISDLANPEVPLRKLSKTIPQGIRGPSLLEQCLQHNIPLSRAIWFTKCVGANEIRTLKRKGVNPTVAQGAELKWLREWTVNVEQFIESMLTQFGQSQWKEKIRYSILFAARLYLENLLDRDHYLDWILKSFAVSNSNHWPFWLMTVHLHRLDLVAFRKKGKQLAENLVTKYNATRNSQRDTLQPLVQSFAAAIRPLISSRPDCFLMPDKWSECHLALASILETGSDIDRQALQHLSLINARVSGGSRQSRTTTASTTEQTIEILDSYRISTSITSYYDSLCQTCPDQDLLVWNCLEWCVSKYRTGKTRIYLVARLLRKMRKFGFDVQKTLLDYVFKVKKNSIDVSALKHLVSELSRSRAFPLSKYLQSLSVRGLPPANSISQIAILSGSSRIDVQESTDIQQLLTEVCLVHYESHLINLRNALLNRAGFDEEAETLALGGLQQVIVTSLRNERDEDALLRVTQIQFEKIPWTMRTRLSYFLRYEIASLTKASQSETSTNPPLPGSNGLNLRRFHIIRNILERANDIAILADVIRIVSASRHEDVLAAAVDTINMHSLALSAIGALEVLQTIYSQTYIMLRSIKTAMPFFVAALINLCEQHPATVAPVRALQQDLIQGDRGRAVTACSPFSDGVAESLQQATGATFHDDFEAILQTESNMNDQTMLRLFKVLIDRIEKRQSESDDEHDLLTLCQLLSRLKLCQRAQGEILMKKWVARLCCQPTHPINSRLLFSLICTRCTSLDVVMGSCPQQPPTAASRSRLHTHIRRAMVDAFEDGIGEALSYSFKLAVSKVVSTRPAELLDIIGSDETGKTAYTSTRATAISAVLANPELIKALSKPAWLVVSQSLSENLSHVNSSEPPEAQARALTMSSDPLSLPFCSLRMRMLCQNAITKNDENIQDGIAAMLCTTVADPQSALSTSPRTFQTMLRATGPIVSAKVRSNIEQAFFSALPKFLQGRGSNQAVLPTLEETERASIALQQLMLVSTDIGTSSQGSGIAALIEKLTVYMKLLGASATATATQSIAASSPITASSPATMPADDHTMFLFATLDHLKLLLQMLCLKRTALIPPSAAPPAQSAVKSLQQDQIKLVGLLITIATHSAWSNVLHSIPEREQQARILEVIDFALDVAATLVDDMSDESRTFCARILKDKTKDARVQWLLGSVNAFGSVQSSEVGHGYQVVNDTKGVLGEWKPKTWEMLESGASGDSCLALGLFGAKKAWN